MCLFDDNCLAQDVARRQKGVTQIQELQRIALSCYSLEMKKRISKELRATIRKDKRPVRVIAAKEGISPTTVQRIKKSERLYDKPRNPEGYPELGLFEEAIFFEMIRLSRYHYKKLIEYLAPIWTPLPSQARQQAGQNSAFINAVNGKLEKRYIDPTTFYRHLRRYASGALLKAKDQKEAPSGSVAIHRILIHWTNKLGVTKKGVVLLLMDRTTGLLYAKAYQRVRTREVAISAARFESMYGNDILSLHFVTATRDRDNLTDEPSFTTVLNLDRDKDDKTRISIRSQEILEDEMSFDFKLHADDNTPSLENSVTVPGTYKNHHELNRAITMLVNTINLTPRNYYYRDSSVEMTPLKKLMKYHQSKGETVSERLMTKRIERRRDWNYGIEHVTDD